ncbi:HlyD family secretion protein [Sphingobacterium gobiense]|nr:HlyD family efflux transporter periplasmic adaptor subunit [Sphingobacterium gobiense]
MKRIFPAEIIEYSVEHHFHRHHTRTLVVYQVLLCAFIIGFISLFFIRVSINVIGGGTLRPVVERNVIKSPVNGKLDRVFIKENQRVATGDVLFTLQTDLLENQKGLTDERQREVSLRIRDLAQLTALKRAGHEATLTLSTALYRQQYQLFTEQVNDAAISLREVKTQFDRQKQLYDKRIISTAEFDGVSYALEKAETRLRVLYDEQVSQWQSDQAGLQQEYMELATKQSQYLQEREHYEIKAPMAGTIQQFNGAQPGNFLTQGETLAEISPDSGLVAEVQVSPKDIGLLKVGMPVKIQVDAFDYNQWGMVEAHVVDVADDVRLTQQGVPIFRVQCQLHQLLLRLPNGYTGTLRKGMSFRARFPVANRTLFQLLYDKADDWLNPSR